MMLSATQTLPDWSALGAMPEAARLVDRVRSGRRLAALIIGSAIFHMTVLLTLDAPWWNELRQELPRLNATLEKRLPPPPPVVEKEVPPPKPTATPTRPSAARQIITTDSADVSPMPTVDPAPREILPVIAPEPQAQLPPPRETVTPVEAPPPVSRRNDAALLDEYSRRLSDIVARHKQYPAIARLRGWQGTTELEVEVGPNGQILATKIARSSGHEALDRQALEMLQKTGQLPPLPAGNRDRPVVLRLPVVFTLVN